ncbi:MAG: carbohydrate ABC transporter permease, partial [Actinomycetota bacterium]|nr:carbohydrate ABC transporter permease [Actinomycetota bacterium]
MMAAVWLVIVGVPVYAMVSWSLQTRDSFLDRGPLALPGSITFANVAEVFDSGFMRYLLNTAIVTAASVALTLVI